MMPRLNAALLPSLPAEVQRPLYDRDALETGIVHIGLGAFHRAHQAVYTEDALNRAFGPWGICGVSLRSPETRDALALQDGLYTVVSRGADGERLRVVGAVTECLVAPEAPDTVLERLARPAVRIVTITVTEKGYCHEPATGSLDERHPDILHDLAHPDRPRTLPGFLVEALDRRRKAGLDPFTVLSCDNLPGNGDVVRKVLHRFAEIRDPALARWIGERLACPNSMVDRIVPATTPEDRSAVSRRLGVSDAWPVVTEAFSQWVVEDHFPTGRPAWEKEGVQMVRDVRPFEMMKLRLLNASHSCIAYLGSLAGYETVARTIADPAFAGFIRKLMDQEVTPTLDLPEGFDVAAYKDALLERFANPALKHRTLQIAMDGSQKLPQRLLGTIAERLQAGAPIDRLALGVAAWMRFVTGRDEQGAPIEIRDPLAGRLSAIVAETGPEPARLVPGLLEITEVFGKNLPANPAFTGTVTQALERLYARGAQSCVEELA
ncbi:mannitol dehydrogenase family protein [Telmatospirillum sp. J64-1]|uniref:mannitol dehydrogenase family protein n=1 Tax=Telmatospirillum sp. J64-1 TaxID=2502183 RepID=UPI001C8F7F1D|nr:mannitol dehydrogenase family protein [Telmatospirillum sp. J64-1]